DTVELPNRKYSKREIVEHANAVCIIAVNDNKLFFVSQYRKAIDQQLMELPAGLIEHNETPKDAAIREMREEIGYNCKNLTYLFDAYSSPGFSDEKVSFFLAEELFRDELEADDDEFLNIELIEQEKLMQMIEDGAIVDGKTIMGILYFLRNVSKC
ncbi:MAG: NUDIX hydrolase, partial [Finegoldia magna]|nr:NUDIX hydrolase [Finegoldia magna]